MTPEQMRRAKSIVEYAAVESLETEEIVLLGWAIQAIAARDAEIADLKRGRDLLDKYKKQHAEEVAWRKKFESDNAIRHEELAEACA